MPIPSRVEVLSWNENQVADLLREHKLLDCVDCVYQRHIDGQKLLNLKEGEVMYFLEIHNEKSREKFWNIIKKVTDKKGGIHNLMKNFEDSRGRINSEDGKDTEGWGSDEFDSDSDSDESDNYDEPEEEEAPPVKPKISLERQETIKQNLMGFIKQPFNPPQSYATLANEDLETPYPEDIYDVPEDGCGEPDQELYETPSDESGGGVVCRKSHDPVQRQLSDMYIVPNEELPQSDDEQYEDLSGRPANMYLGTKEELPQEEYVVPDNVPPRPPKPPNKFSKPVPPRPAHSEEDSGDEYIEPDMTENHRSPSRGDIKKAVMQEQENYEPPKPKPKMKSLEKKKTIVIEQENYEPPKPKPKMKSLEKKKPVVEQENYEPPKPQPKLKSLDKKKPVVEEQLNYEPPQPPRKPASSNKKPVVEEQPNYEPPAPPKKNSKPAINKKPADKEPDNIVPPPKPQRLPSVELEEEDEYLVPDMDEKNPEEDLDWQEDYEVPDRSDQPEPPEASSSPPPRPIKAIAKNFLGQVRHASQKLKGPPKSPQKKPIQNVHGKQVDRKTSVEKTSSSSAVDNGPNQESSWPHAKPHVTKKTPPSPKSSPKPPSTPQPPPKPQASPRIPAKSPPSPQVTAKPQSPEKKKSLDKRKSLPLPSLPPKAPPTDQVDSTKSDPPLPPRKSPGSTSPKRKATPSATPSTNGPVPPSRSLPGVPSKPPPKTKEQLLREQPWFHGSISKAAYSEKIKSAKQDGAYLVRNSSRDPGKYIMTISYKNDIRHLNMPHENGQYRLGDSGTVKFDSVIELVEYFKTHDVVFSSGGKTYLTHPCLK